MSLVKGKKGLIMGVANERSIAWGISQKLAEAGAELAFTYLGDALKKRVIPLAKSLNSDFTLSCNVENKEEIATVVSATSKNITTDLSASGKVFVYGREVDDFRTVDYQAISMLNVSATQELLKRIKALENENKKLKETNTELMGLKSKIETLERSVSLLLEEKNTVKVKH